MNTSILFAIWLNHEAKPYCGAYGINNKLYYTEDSINMIQLFELFLDSKFYADNLTLDIVLKDSELVKGNLETLEVKENDYHKKSELSNLYLDAKTLHEDISKMEWQKLDTFVETLKK